MHACFIVAEYPGESEFLGECYDPVLGRVRNKADVVATDFIRNVLRKDMLEGTVRKCEDIDPSMVTNLRNVSMADSGLDPDDMKVLRDWLQSIGEESPNPTMNYLDLAIVPNPTHENPVTVETQTPGCEGLEPDWIPRKINFEMLTAFHYEDDECIPFETAILEPLVTPTVNYSLPKSNVKPVARRTTLQQIVEYYGEGVPRSLMDLIGEGGYYDTPSAQSLLSQADSLCPEGLGPEDPMCISKIHDPSLKK